MSDSSITYRKRRPGQPLRSVTIRAKAADPTRGMMVVDGRPIPVALGRGGIRANKREGDGATPRGVFRPRQLWFRADRHPRPQTLLPVRAITPNDAWDENPASRSYNRHLKLPREACGDHLMRPDDLYDFIVEIDHNTRPRIAGRGSAVFLHLARPRFAPTAGCVAMKRAAMLQLLKRLGSSTRIIIT